MPGPSRKAAAWLPILVILVAMTSIQSGASLAKSAVPGGRRPGRHRPASGAGNADSGGGVQAMAATFLPGAARAAATVRPGARGDELSLFIYPCSAFRSAWRWPWSLPARWRWRCLVRAARWILSGWRWRSSDYGIFCRWGRNVAQVDLTGALFALGAGACWAVYVLTGQRAGEEHGPATVAMGSLIASLVFVPLGMAQATDTLWQWSLLPLGLGIAILSTALPYSLEMMALTRLPTRTFGTLMSLEPALAALSGMIFLGETLKLSQTLALGAIIIASMGATLTMQRQSKVESRSISINILLRRRLERNPGRSAEYKHLIFKYF